MPQLELWVLLGTILKLYSSMVPISRLNQSQAIKLIWKFKNKKIKFV